jgi:hypothetical protein
MKRKILFLIATLTISFAAFSQNLLKNSDMETQGDWLVNNCDPKDLFTVTFGSTTSGPEGGSGKCLELVASISTSAEVFVYQPVIVKGGHTYKFSVAMRDLSSNLNNDWIEIAWLFNRPVEGKGIEENKPGLFGSWSPCNGVGFDGLIDNSCAVGRVSDTIPYPYFQIGDTITTDTIYFGVDIGTWGTADIDIVFDNITLVDSLSSNAVHNISDARNFNAYPSVTTGKLNFNCKASKVTISNILGQNVRQLKFSGYNIDISDLKNGVYFVNVNDKYITKVIKR